MSAIRERSFEHNGRRFVVRAAAFDQGWKIRVFDPATGKPATDIVYRVEYDTAMDAALSKTMPIDLVEQQMETAEGDIVRGYAPLLA